MLLAIVSMGFYNWEFGISKLQDPTQDPRVHASVKLKECIRPGDKLITSGFDLYPWLGTYLGAEIYPINRAFLTQEFLNTSNIRDHAIADIHAFIRRSQDQDVRIFLLEEALNGTAKLLTLGRFTGSLRFLLGGVVRMTIDGLAVETLRHAMARAPMTRAGYPALLEALGQIDALATARWCMLSERAHVHAIHEEFRRSPNRRAYFLPPDEYGLLRLTLKWIPDGILRRDRESR